MTSVAEAAYAVRLSARALADVEGYADLVSAVGDRRLVLLGEATHGTHEFYDARAEIIKRLILERGFGAVAVEADWPDAYRVNRYVRLKSNDTKAAGGGEGGWIGAGGRPGRERAGSQRRRQVAARNAPSAGR